MIVDARLVYQHMVDNFEDHLQEQITLMQADGLKVDVQFSMNSHGFSALLIGSRSNAGI